MPEPGNPCRKSLSAIARRHNLMFEYEQISWLPPMNCHAGIVELLEAQASLLGYSYERMPSGAGHDTQFLAEITRAGLLFVPSVGGVSHSPDEWTYWDDVENGANVLLNAALVLANETP